MSNFEAFRISGEQAADVRTSQRSKYPDIFVFADRCADIIDGAVARARLQSLRQPKEMVTGLFLAARDVPFSRREDARGSRPDNRVVDTIKESLRNVLRNARSRRRRCVARRIKES